MDKYGSSIEFKIDKFENNSIQISNLLFKNETNQPYDSTGAAKYIVGFILIYGFAIVLFIGSQVKSSRSQDDNVDSQNAEQVLQQMESTIFTKEVLNKLLDKEHREKAWKIYLTNDKEMKDPNSSSANTDEEELMKQVVVQEAIENMERKANEKQPKPTKLEIFRDRIISLCTKQKRSPTHLRMKENWSSHENKVVIKTPQIRLQTDEEGLQQLKNATRSTKKKHSSINTNEETIPNIPALTLKNQTNYSSDNQNENLAVRSQHPKSRQPQKQSNSRIHAHASNDVVFDVCEISEQITTV